HFRFDKWIVINIPSASLRYYEYDSCRISCRVVVGKPSTRTPRFAASCNEVILYPYWNVPRSIAVKELLPLFKRIPSLPDSLEMQLLDASGRTVDLHTVQWASLSKTNFPYSIRQSTGCHNALGVVKFNLTSPYSVYLHDTNVKSAFRSSYRYYSHGCIRIEQPIRLAEALLPGQVDTSFLLACYRDLKPVTIRLPDPVPVFVIYAMAGHDASGNLTLFRDIYHLYGRQ
ncbi:MAG: L,D-transpeptidase family protein, partial [Bacteroidetes bacterium]|nr:L,D-transpeptidase family protein [Bacteroidota bacterium]